MHGGINFMQKNAAAIQMHKDLPAGCQTGFVKRGKNTELLDW